MKRSFFAIFLLTISCTEVQAPTGGEARAVTAFVGVNVVPMDSDRIVENQTVLVENGRIAAFGPAGEVEVPEGATRIDGAGKYLMPGLAEMHGHLPNPDTPAVVTENVPRSYATSPNPTSPGMSVVVRPKSRDGISITKRGSSWTAMNPPCAPPYHWCRPSDWMSPQTMSAPCSAGGVSTP